MSAARITRGESELGCWEIATARPGAALAPWVRGYVGLTSRLALTAERHLPSGEAALLVNLGEPYDAFGPNGAVRVGRTALMGVHAAPFRTLCSGRKDLALVRLAPAAGQRLLGLPMSRLANRWAPLEDLDPHMAHALAADVARASDWTGRFQAIERVLGARLAGAAPSLAGAAWQAIVQAGGSIRVGALAAAAGASRRRLLDAFRREIGVSPKTAARLARFNRVLSAMGRTQAVPGADAAAEHGYFDQAHMIADFRAFAGATPTAVLSAAVAFTLRA